MAAVPIPRRGLAGLIIAVLLTAGCQTIDGAGRVVSRADLVNQLAARLDGSRQLTYAADYRLPEGRSASIAQAPPRTTYRYPGGTLTVTPEAITECVTGRRPATCTLNPPPARNTPAPVTIFEQAKRRGLITPAVAAGLLTAAALDASAIIEQADTTVAGRHATCVSVRQLSNAAASAFDICVTTEGVLGSFSGVVDGVETELALSHYRDTVDQTAFEPPAGADLVDRRPDAQ